MNARHLALDAQSGFRRVWKLKFVKIKINLFDCWFRWIYSLGEVFPTCHDIVFTKRLNESRCWIREIPIKKFVCRLSRGWGRNGCDFADTSRKQSSCSVCGSSGTLGSLECQALTRTHRHPRSNRHYVQPVKRLSCLVLVSGNRESAGWESRCYF